MVLGVRDVGLSNESTEKSSVRSEYCISMTPDMTRCWHTFESRLLEIMVWFAVQSHLRKIDPYQYLKSNSIQIRTPCGIVSISVLERLLGTVGTHGPRGTPGWHIRRMLDRGSTWTVESQGKVRIGQPIGPPARLFCSLDWWEIRNREYRLRIQTSVRYV